MNLGVLTASTLVSRESVVAYLLRQGFMLAFGGESVQRFALISQPDAEIVTVPLAWDTCEQRARTMVLVETGLALEKTEVEVLWGICAGAAGSPS